jgi:FixJ family two-component response regulator
MTDHLPGSIIAVVDDDWRTLESLQSLLESADYSVRLFASGTALVDSGCISVIACLISDISMPVMDGFELARVVHAARPGLPIILITARADMLSRLPPVAPGHYRLFKKPFDGEELLTAVSDSVRDSHLRKPRGE